MEPGGWSLRLFGDDGVLGHGLLRGVSKTGEGREVLCCLLRLGPPDLPQLVQLTRPLFGAKPILQDAYSRLASYLSCCYNPVVMRSGAGTFRSLPDALVMRRREAR